MLAVAWLVGFILLGAYVARAFRRREEPVARSHALGLGLALVGLAALAAEGFGAQVAAHGHTQVGARLFVRWVQLELYKGEARIGYAPDASLLLPRGYGLAEAQRGWDVLHLSASGATGLAAEAATTPEPTTTRVLLTEVPPGDGTPQERLAQATHRLIDGRRCRNAAGPVTASTTIAAVLCSGDEPRAGLLIERDLPWKDAAPERLPLRVAPFLWQDGSWHAHSLPLAPGQLVQMGAVADAVPGLTLWELPAPAGRTELFFPPRDLGAPCDEWTRGAGFLGAEPTAPPTGRAGDTCVLPLVPPFGLEVRRLAPSPSAIGARSLLAAGLLAAPVLFVLVAFATQPRSELDPERFARLAGVAWVAAFLGALAVWRLLWAGRIDALRRFEAVGPLTLQNQSFVVLAAATLAATAVLAWSRAAVRWAIGAWAVFAVGGAIPLVPDARELLTATDAPKLVATALLSLALGTAIAWWPLVRERLARLRTPTGILVGLVAVGLGAAVLRHHFGVLPKLACAWAFVFLLYAGLRAGGLRIAMAGAIGGALLVYGDTGVALAVAAPGALAAVLLAAHDQSYREDDARTLDGYDRHVPLLRMHSWLALAIALGVASWAAVTLVGSIRAGESDGAAARSFTEGALWLPLCAALLVGAVAWAAHRRGERARAGRWLVLALSLAVVWAARGFLVGRALATHTRAAQRVGLVVDPAYSLLANERDFQRGLAAWNETRAPEAPMATGEGYFGARIVDSGVRHSIDNDYLAVLALRETGLFGLGTLAGAFSALVVGAAMLASARFPAGSPAQRARLVAALVLGALCVYQPIAAVGALPLTGIAWPGLGLNSPTDFWLFVILLLAFACWGTRETEPAAERELRATTRYQRTRRLATFAQVALAAACLLLVVRAGAFALRRPTPILMAGGSERLIAPFESLSDAVDYVDRLHCGAGDPVPREILGDPATTDGLRRFHHAFVRAWQSARPAAAAIAREFTESGRCNGSAGWTADADGNECRLSWKFGWPEVHLTVSRQGAVQCDVEARPEPLRALRPPNRPVDAERIRLVSRPRGAAAGDLGELIAGGVVVRLRPSATGKPLDAAAAAPGLYFASELRLSDDLALTARDGQVRLLRRGAPAAREPAWLIVRQAATERVAESDDAGWSVHALGADAQKSSIPLGAIALVVTGRAHGRTVWLYRPSAEPLLADDVATASGRRWRHYVYGGLLPELGWVNPYESQMSLGLDGWVHVAAAEHERQLAALSKAPRELEAPACGTLHPPVEDGYAQVCSRSAADGVLECAVSLQPELQIRLRHLLELASQAPELFPRPMSGRPARLAQRAEVALLAGDSGEILARADFVPGRESSAYAPRTPEIEQYLIRLREGRDPRTGKRLSHPGEAGALKADWSQRIAIGSTMKPLLAHAFERADPQLAARLLLSAPGENATGECPGGWPPLLGHCPPTRSMWDEGQLDADVPRWVAQSLNWYQAAIGFLGTAAGGGSFGFGEDGMAQSPADLTQLSLDQATRAAALWTKTASGRQVLSAHSIVDLDALRETPLWREFEAIVGRPLCTGPGAAACERKSERADLCAARALPIHKPSRDLRHLVATGPSDFDFLPAHQGGRVGATEYFQFLRGSGIHELGSLLQLADAFNRLFYERAPQTDGAYRLAASWFPVRAAGSLPPWSCPAGDASAISRGLCDVIFAPHGTAKSLEPLLTDGDLVIYGAKTGTIDALRDVAEHKTSCEQFNQAHTIPGATRQPYHLPCGRGARADINDSLLVIAFGVRAGDKTVPLLLALRFQGVGQGYATAVARPFIDAVRGYFAAVPPASSLASQK